MNKRLKVLKRALRFHIQDQDQHALLELNALLNEYNDFGAAYCVRARVFERRSNYPAAIADYTRALSESCLSKRNTMRIVQNILVCSSKLNGEQKVVLSNTLREDLGLKDKYWNSDSWSVVFGWGHREKILEAQRNILATPENTGRIANIGRFLLDSNDVEKLAMLVSQKEPSSGYRTLTTYGWKQGS